MDEEVPAPACLPALPAMPCHAAAKHRKRRSVFLPTPRLCPGKGKKHECALEKQRKRVFIESIRHSEEKRIHREREENKEKRDGMVGEI